MEIDRLKTAQKDGSQIIPSSVDPEYQRKLLLFRHPDIARQLGLEVPSAAATQPVAPQ
jgi:hypothetical protein